MNGKYKGCKSFVSKECIMCGKPMKVPKYFETKITCCSRECSNRKISLSKMKGMYVLCDMCDKPKWIMPKEYKKAKHFCSRKCDHLYRQTIQQLGVKSKRISGEKKYYGENWHRQRNIARELRNFTCEICHISEEKYEKQMSVHHIVPFSFFKDYLEANMLSNLLVVCEHCHRKIHSGENHPSKFNKDNIKNPANIKNGNVRMTQKDTAKEIVNLLKTTNLTISRIAERVGCSTTTVKRIYDGERWTELYDKPIYLTNPRAKSQFKRKKHLH